MKRTCPQILGGVGHVWNPEDVFTLRTKYRIIGSLVGNFPKQCRWPIPNCSIYSALMQIWIWMNPFILMRIRIRMPENSVRKNIFVYMCGIIAWSINFRGTFILLVIGKNKRCRSMLIRIQTLNAGTVRYSAGTQGSGSGRIRTFFAGSGKFLPDPDSTLAM